MDSFKDRGTFNRSRRDFTTMAGLGVAAFSMPTFGLVSNTGAASGFKEETVVKGVLPFPTRPDICVDDSKQKL